MSAVSDNNQVNFNPAWMQSPVQRGDRQGFGRISVDSDDSKEMIAPVFANHRYGREDILALETKGTKPPDGLYKCPFVVDEGQSPIILTSLSETELRLQQNINSSKALSLVNHQERMGINGTGTGPQPASPWSRGAKQPGSRWSALTSGESSPGTAYVKAGMGRGAPSAGRGGGIVGGATSRGGFRSGFEKPVAIPGADRTRSRLKSTGEEEGPGGWTVVGAKSPSQDNSSIWRGSGGRADPLEEHNGFNRSSRGVPGQLRPGVGRYSSTTDKFYPDFKRSESHEPIEDWVSSDKHKSSERQTASNSPPAGKSLQYPQQLSPFENVAPSESDTKVTENPPPDHDLHHLIQAITSSPTQEYEKWCYLDPDDREHGPYEGPQMLIWFKNKFFSEDLRCRRVDDRGFTTLGDLIRHNGIGDPFATSKSVETSAAANAWHNNGTSEAQKKLLEDRRRLEEQQEKFRREEQEREEREQRLRQMEQEVERRRQELHRIALAKEEELDNRRRQLLEIEKQREEADRRAAEQRALDAAELRHFQEMREREHREMEAQQRAAEEQMRIKRERAEQEAARLREQTLAEARRIAAEETEKHRQQLLQKQEENQRIQAEQTRQLMEAQKRRQAEEASAREAARNAAAAQSISKTAPWVGKAAEKTHQLQTQRSLLEIQLEEEQRLAEQRKRDLELFEQQKRQQKVVAASPWTGAAATTISKTPWNNSPVLPTKNLPNRDSAWPAIPSATPAAIKKEATKAQPAKAPVSDKKKATKGADEFKKWVVKSINQLNKTVGTNVEAEPFTAFIEGVENPDEVEDYFLSYFGETGPVKDFHREFLEKRIELRPRHKINDKDDLSAAQAAVTVAPSQPMPPAAQPAGKKKKPKANKTIDINVLGFKPAGDPNRINVGEIDIAPPVAATRKKR